MMGEVQAPEWLVINELLRQFGKTSAKACECYVQVVREAQMQSSIWPNLQNQLYLGDERSVAQLRSRLKDKGTL